ncbi:MAG: adenylate/guanylate cyclase domain-containing protein [Candidatus Melainabacteria bacterium]|nr:adenylate/guanylate cyclase domain-containing protein [Candidatus Melainabacteria bacterium]
MKPQKHNLLARTFIYSLLIIITSLICYYKDLPLISRFISEIEAKSYDLLFITRHNLKLNPSPPENIVIVGIDATSIKQVAVPWPWPRQFHASLVDGLKASGAKAIAFDIIFDTISPLSLQTQDIKGGETISQSTFDEGKEDDGIFAKSIKKAKNVFLACEAQPKNNKQFESANPITPLLEAINFDPSFLGNTNVQYDDDNFIRRAKLIFPEFQEDPSVSVSLPLRIVQYYLNSKIQILPDYSVQLGKNKIPHKFLINFYGPNETIKTISYSQALENIYSNKKNMFEDKIVLVGRTNLKASIDPFKSVRSPDTFPTPFSSITPNFSGVEVQANIISNILNQDFIRTPNTIASIMLFLLVTLITIFIITAFRANLILSFYLCASVAIAYLFLVIASFIALKTALPVTYPIYGVIFPIYFINFLDQYFFVDSARRKQAKVFRQMVPPQVAEEIERMDMETLALGGTKRQVTILFADIKNFTGICSEEKPEIVINILNKFFTEMVYIIHMHDGLVDKFIGDAIMAMWGSPKTLPKEEQIIFAANCALSMKEELKSLNSFFNRQGFNIPIHIRIGINTDEVITGNVGSPDRMQFSAIGDGVNIASRLEAVNKFYGTDILMSENSAKELKDKNYYLREIDTVFVPGKETPINIYELMSHRENITELIEIYNRALNLYRNKNFQEAYDLWNKCLVLDTYDRPSHIMAERCKKLLKEENLANWQPVWKIENK